MPELALPEFRLLGVSAGSAVAATATAATTRTAGTASGTSCTGRTGCSAGSCNCREASSHSSKCLYMLGDGILGLRFVIAGGRARAGRRSRRHSSS